MRKIYSFILTALLLLGTSDAWGTFYLFDTDASSQTSAGSKVATFTGSGTTFIASCTLSQGTHHVYVTSTTTPSRGESNTNDCYLNAKQTINSFNSITLYQYGMADFTHAITLTTPIAGTYYFKFSTDGGYSLQCAYPNFTIVHNWANRGGSWSSHKVTMTDSGDGIQTVIGEYGGSDCTYETNGSSKTIAAANLNVDEGVSVGDFCTFTLDVFNQTITVAPTTATIYDVDIYVKSPYDRYLYAYDNDIKLPYNGLWRGAQSGVSKDANGYYKYSIKAVGGHNLSLIFNYEYSGNSYQSPALNVGTISSDKTLYYTLDEYCHIAYVEGDFNSWESQVTTLPATINLSAGTHYFKVRIVRDGESILYGKSSTTIVPGSNTVSGLVTTAGSDYNIALNAVFAGNYNFSWDNSGYITVTYPTDFPSRSIGVGNWGTICLPIDATIEGADLYSISNIAASALTVSPKIGDDAHTLVAGKPYFIKGTSASQTITLLNTAYAASAGTDAGLVGTYADETTVPEGKYMLYNNKIYKVGEGCTVDAYHAYLNITVPNEAPAAIRIVEEENNATGVDNIESNEKAVKFFENGKLYILREGVVYDATGRAIK